MIDLRALRENPEPFRASQRARGADVDLVDRVIAADETRRQALAAFENLRAEQKQVSRSVGKASPEERPAILANAKELAEQVKAAEAASSAAAAELDDLARQFANLIEGAPSGGEEDYVVLRHEGGDPRDFAAEGFEPADHLAIGEGLDIFCAMLGTVSSNLALTLGARGGVYLCGGIIRRFIDYFVTSPFRNRFESKGRFEGYLAVIPVYIVLAQNPGLIGAAVALSNQVDA